MADKIVVDITSNIGAIVAEQEKYVNSLKETDTELKKINKTTEQQQKELQASIQRQKDAIKELNKQLEDTAPGLVKRDLKRTIDETTRSMNIQQGKLNALTASFNKQGGILEVLRARTKNLQDAREKADDPKRIERLNELLKKNNDRINSLTKSGESQNKVFGELGGILKKVSLAAVIAFAAKKMAEFGKEALQVAINAEGIQNAFDKLNRPDLLDDLRKATSGTVNDVELMQAAVRAENFDIPLGQLARMFEFASQRATDTGQSVDYLVNSIIDGVGRKSTLVIDNLGISAERVQEEFKRTGDFALATANIIEEEMGNAGDSVETAGTKLARINARFENFKLAVGNILLDIATPFINFLDGASNGFADMAISAEDAGDAIRVTTEEIEKFTKQKAAFEFIPKSAADFEAQADAAKRAGLTLDEYQAKLAEQKKAREDAVAAALAATQKEIITLNSLKEELKLYQDALANAVIGSKEFTQAQLDIAATQAKIDAALGKTQKQSKEYLEAQKDISKGLVENEELYQEEFNKTIKKFQDGEEAKRKAAEESAELSKKNREDQQRKHEEYLEELEAERKAVEAQAEFENEIRIKSIENRIAVFSATSDLIGSLAALGAKNAGFQKALATFQIGIDTARAISGVTAAALSKGALGVPEYISILAIILNSIGQAKAALSAEAVPQFAEGVIGFKGKGTDTSDSNLVAISNNESIIKARSTKKHPKLLGAINDDDDNRIRDILISDYMPNFADNLKNALVLNFNSEKLEGLMKENTKTSKANTILLAGVMQSQTAQLRKYKYIDRKQSKL